MIASNSFNYIDKLSSNFYILFSLLKSNGMGYFKWINCSKSIITDVGQNVPILSFLGILTHRAVSIGIPKLHVINFEIQMRFCSGNFRKYFSKPKSLLN
jgi:hypothetical protein